MAINADKKRVSFRLLTPEGRVLATAVERWILEGDLQRGWINDTDEKDNLIRVRIPAGSHIIEVLAA